MPVDPILRTSGITSDDDSVYVHKAFDGKLFNRYSTVVRIKDAPISIQTFSAQSQSSERRFLNNHRIKTYM